MHTPDDMNISASISIKGAWGSGAASGKYIDTDKFKESDLNFFIQVKVTNQDHMPVQYKYFNHIETILPSQFTEVYGVRSVNGFPLPGTI